jgi:hypothetical protein
MHGSTNADQDDSIDQQIEEISEQLYLSAYFHFDKGSGNTIEDITENNNECVILYTNPSVLTGDNLTDSDVSSKVDDFIWTPVLEEFEPLEYEDKWGKKSPPPHAIKFSSKNSFNI